MTALVAVVLAVALMVAVGAVLRRPALLGLPYVDALGTLGLFVGLVIALLPLYYVLPPVDVEVEAALPGTVLTAVGWLVLQWLFQLYVADVSRYQAYGVLGAVLLFLTWLYFAGALLLVGAVLNAVLDGRAGDPADHQSGSVARGRDA